MSHHTDHWPRTRGTTHSHLMVLLDQGEHMDATPPINPREAAIRKTCAELADFLVEKNRAYGDSVSQPMSVFAKRVDRLAAIDVRIDDKLSRLARGTEFPGDDTVKDLAGYLVLRMVVSKE